MHQQDTPVKFVYTLSDERDLVSLTIKSIKSLLRFTNKENIIVFYTPPRSSQNLVKLSRLAVVKQVPSLTKSFFVKQHNSTGRYGEKIHLCDVDCPNVVFLDCDTIVKKNLLPLLEGDFDFAARCDIDGKTGQIVWESEVWKSMFKKVGRKPIPMPNSGFMIFKNYCHRKIREEWMKMMSGGLPEPHYSAKEQCALALCVGAKRIKWLSSCEHAFGWLDEDKGDTYILHGRQKSVWHKIAKYVITILRMRVES